MDREFGNVTYNEYSVNSSQANNLQDISSEGTHLTVLRGIGSNNGSFSNSYLQFWRSDDAQIEVTSEQNIANINAFGGNLAWIGINGTTFVPEDCFYFDTVQISLPDGSVSELLIIIDANYELNLFALNGAPMMAGDIVSEQEATDFLLLLYSGAHEVTYGNSIAPMTLGDMGNTTQVPFDGTLDELQSKLSETPSGKFEPPAINPTTTLDSVVTTDETETEIDAQDTGEDDTTQNIVGSVGITTGTYGPDGGETTTIIPMDLTTDISAVDETVVETKPAKTQTPIEETQDDLAGSEITDTSDAAPETKDKAATVLLPDPIQIPAYNEIIGSEHSDNIQGTDIEDHIFAFEGNDTVYARGGDDLIFGNSGDDMLFGGDGNDQIYASDGDDLIEGGNGNDSISAGNGSDTIIGGNGDDLLRKLSGQGKIDGGSGADIMIGGYNNDHLIGGAGNDVIVGDMSVFMGGADTIIGGQGNDILSGGIGADTFVFRPNSGDDTIASVDILAAQNNTLDPSSFGNDFSGMDRIHLVGFENIDAASLWNHIIDTDQGALFSAEGTSILFVGLSQDDLSVDHFVFG